MKSLRISISTPLRTRIPAHVPHELCRRLGRAARRLGASRQELWGTVVRLVDDQEMARLRVRHLGEQDPTDVLSFPARDAEDSAAFGEVEPSLGVLVLDWELAERQALARHVDVEVEAADLLVHGLAHLLGHDHGTSTQARRMLECERRGARAAGLVLGPRPYA